MIMKKTFTILFIFLLSASVLAQAIPLNAVKSSYGDGWTCKRGYKKIGSGCIHGKFGTDDEIRELIIARSISGYSGNCPCPYFADRAGRRCGRRSAYSRAGGAEPICYKDQISKKYVNQFKKRFK